VDQVIYSIITVYSWTMLAVVQKAITVAECNLSMESNQNHKPCRPEKENADSNIKYKD